MSRPLTALPLSAIALLITACSGGGTQTTIASAPAPIPTPTPTPTPTSPIKPSDVALKSDTPLVTYGVAEQDTLSAPSNLSGSKDLEKTVAFKPGNQGQKVDFRYDPATGEYAISLPDGSSGKLVLAGLNGTWGQLASSTFHQAVSTTGATVAEVTLPTPKGPFSPYSYSHYGYWEQSGTDGSALTKTYGLFAYGIETPSSGVPLSGTATFNARIHATSSADPFEVDGPAVLSFDFGRGTLTGWMNPVHDTNGWYPTYDYDYGRYEFTQTVYSAGSSRYSGIFAKSGAPLTGSFFEGSLTGPQASETVARFVVPFTRNGTPGSISGIWIGTKD